MNRFRPYFKLIDYSAVKKGSFTVTKDLIAAIDKQIITHELSTVTSLETINSFMGTVGDNALNLQKQHYNNIHSHVKNEGSGFLTV